MTRPRHLPDLGRIINSLSSRIAALERATRDVITPVSTTAATINQTAHQTPYMALVNPLGATVTWWVYVTPTAGTTTRLQLRGDDGAVGPVVAAATSGSSTVAVSLTCPPSWQPGTQHLVYLDAWIDLNSATVVPVRALIN